MTRVEFAPVEEQLAVIKRGLVDLISEPELRKRLEASRASGTPLRVKFGMDPSSADLHVGHSVPLRKLRAIQELGHQIVLIVGDSTAMVGDPSGRNKLRPQLTREAVDLNLATYTEQAALVLDMDRTEVHRNSEWFDAMDFQAFIKLCSRMTVARMIERDTFQNRMEAQEPIGINEFVYPLMQGWDSVQIRADLEIGGNDQLFNLLVGRNLQEQEGQAPQICFTTPLINGLDGRKMSKSYGNAVGLTDEPADMFGKVMSVEDEAMESWFTLLTDVSDTEIQGLLGGHPREAKARLAEEITRSLHGPDAGAAAREAFDRQFRDKQLPTDIPEHPGPEEWGAEGVPLFVLLRELGIAKSSSEGRRLVTQGAVRLDGEVHKDPNHPVLPPGAELLVQAGKRRFVRIPPRT